MFSPKDNDIRIAHLCDSYDPVSIALSNQTFFEKNKKITIHKNRFKIRLFFTWKTVRVNVSGELETLKLLSLTDRLTKNV